VLSRQVLYHLSHAPIPFCFSYFSDRVLSFCMASLGLQSSYLCLLPRKHHRHAPPHLACLLRWGLANLFPKLALNLDFPNLHLLCSWDYRHASLYLAFLFLSHVLPPSLLPFPSLPSFTFSLWY
jgi:hypothetical protein